MSVSPYEVRLSEETLARAIVSFYTSCRLIPCGVSTVALEKWAGKMAHGARKLVGKFRRVYAATPANAKNESLRALKLRCQKAGISPQKCADAAESQPSKSETTESRACSHEDLEEIAPLDTSSVSWVERLKQKLLEKKKSQEEKLAQRPVATPARADGHRVPEFVLENMAKSMPEVKPFATTSTEDDAAKADGAEEKKTAAKSSSKKSSKAKAKAKGKKKEITGTEVEIALKLEEPVVVVQPGSAAAAAVEGGNSEAAAVEGGDAKATKQYKPNEFSAFRKAYIAELRKTGMKFKEANDAWMLSNERAEFVSCISFAEAKKRRFIC